MSTRGSYSPRKLGTIIDMAHIIIGILIMVMGPMVSGITASF